MRDYGPAIDEALAPLRQLVDSDESEEFDTHAELTQSQRRALLAGLLGIPATIAWWCNLFINWLRGSTDT